VTKEKRGKNKEQRNKSNEERGEVVGWCGAVVGCGWWWCPMEKLKKSDANF
jgi:hypothetical protein